MQMLFKTLLIDVHSMLFNDLLFKRITSEFTLLNLSKAASTENLNDNTAYNYYISYVVILYNSRITFKSDRVKYFKVL